MGQTSSTGGEGQGRTTQAVKEDGKHLGWLKERFEELRDTASGLSCETFDKLLAFPGAESIGYRWLAHHPDIKDKPTLTFDDYVAVIRDSTRQTSSQFMFSLFSKDGVLHREDAFTLFNTGRVLSLAAGYHDRDALSADVEETRVATWLATGLFPEDGEDAKTTMAEEEFVRWISRNTPRLFDGVFRWIEIQVSTPAGLHLKERQMDLTDIVIALEGDNLEGSMMTPSVAWLLSSSFPASYDVYGVWRLLYGSHLHGQSGNRFQHHTYRYSGASITLVRTRDGSVFATAVDEEWKERSAVWGGDNCRLLRAAPSVRMDTESVRVYDDLHTRHKQHGFGFGRSPNDPTTATLWLDKGLSDGSSTMCHGAAGTRQNIEIDRVEVWGCGGDDALSQQDRQRRRDQLAAEQRQRAKRPGAEDWNDSVDRQLLSMAGVLTLDEQAREDLGHLRAEHKTKTASSSNKD